MKASVRFIQLMVICWFLAPSMINAQEVTKSPADTVYGLVKKINSEMSVWNKLKISGYVQAQWQKADTIGSPAKYSGGNFNGLDNRFQVRRGRLKVEYINDFSRYVLQIDVTQNGVAIKDAYASFTDRWLKMFTLTGGAFNRPFGYEVGYSSASLESPERARIVQALFPNEEDIGAQLGVQAPPASSFNFIKLQGGLFSGNGLSPETDKYKDFIGQVILKKSFMNGNLTLSGGASYYNGGIAAITPAGNINNTAFANLYSWENGAMSKDSLKGGDKLKREYAGLDLQATFHSTLGMTTLRGEYIMGTQPGTSSVNYSPSNDQPVPSAVTYISAVVRDTAGTGKLYRVTTKTVSTPASMNYYSRSFSGGYITFIQSIMQTRHEFVLKYDWYDPNTNVTAKDIGKIAGTTPGDVKFSTLGLGWIYHWNSNIKLTVYYEMVRNEKASAPLTASGINGTNNNTGDLKDDILTLRLQFKF